MAATPRGYRAMAWLGLASNALLLVYSILLVIAVTFNLGDTDDEVLFSAFYNATAISYSFCLLYLPLCIVGVKISWRLVKRRSAALNHVRLFIFSSMMLLIAETFGEAKFNLDAGTGTSFEIAIGAFSVLVFALVLSYWDRDLMRKYLEEYSR
jgi:hypothetical protein